MKTFTTFFLVLFFTVSLFAQNSAPVANDDVISDPILFNDTITIFPLQNDFDPDGDQFALFQVGGGDFVLSNTDSTITIYFDCETMFSANGEKTINYLIRDEFGNIDTTSGAVIHFTIGNNAFSTLEINNINAKFWAFGNHFWDFENYSNYFFPNGGSTSSMFSTNMWFGGMDQLNELHVAGERYRQIGSDYHTGPLSFNDDSCWITPDVVAAYFKIWKLDKAEVEYHILHYSDTGYEPIENIATWPAHGDITLNQAEYLAPFIDSDNNGEYDPMQGDYPLIRGDQSLFFIFNDQMNHSETGGLPFGIEVHGFAYAFDAPGDPWLDNTTFLSYKIFNRSQNTYSDSYAGIWSDIDLGFAWDDFVGCDVERGVYYCYNGEPVDGSGEPESYGAYPPAQGVVILGGPYMDADGEDNPAGGCDESINGVGFGDGEEDNERYGMNNFIYFNNGGSLYATDPNDDQGYYNYLQGIWMDGTHMLYGGNGHASRGAYGPEANFMFPGTSDPCNWGTGGVPPNGPVDWTEITTGNTPMDRRGLSSMGPFTLEPGGFQKIDMAFVSALGEDYMASVDVLKEYIDLIKEDYKADPDHFGYAWLGTHENNTPTSKLNIFPNPVIDQATFSYQKQSREAQLLIYDEIGRMVKSEKISSNNQQSIDLSNIGTGIYIAMIIDGDQLLTCKLVKK